MFLKKLIVLFLLFTLSNSLFAGNFFVKSKIRQAELKLYFSSDIKRVTYFSIPVDGGITKYVYDIHGAILPSHKGISQHTFRTVKSFRIAQNSPSKLRVIIQSKQKALDQHVFKGNILAIPLVHGHKATLVQKEKKASVALESSSSSSILSSLKRSNVEMKLPLSGLAATKILNRPLEKHQYIIVIDAGHGGKDNGASCCHGRTEKRVTMSVADKLEKILKEKGYKVYMTRDDDSFVRLPKRTEFANNKRADIFVSIHANAAPDKAKREIFKGIEVYYLSKARTYRAKEAMEKENAVMFQGKDFYTKNAYLSLISEVKVDESHKLGIDVHSFMLKHLRKHYSPVDSGGVKGANFWVLVGAQMPAVLVETGYLTHPIEGEHLMQSYYKELLAKGIADGIERYLRNK